MTTVVAALIGAIIGSIGAQVTGDFLRRRGDKESARRVAVDRYLLQLQDAVESLYARLTNISSQGGRSVMSDEYYTVSTLYVLGCLLAQKRRLLLDGMYSGLKQIEPELGRSLQAKLENAERVIGKDDVGGNSFQRYNRLALAESVMERDITGWVVGSYSDFARRYKADDAGFRDVLAPSERYVEDLHGSNVEPLLSILHSVGQLLGMHTGIPGLRGEPGIDRGVRVRH